MTTKEFEQKIKRVLITEEEIQAIGDAIQSRPEVAGSMRESLCCWSAF